MVKYGRECPADVQLCLNHGLHLAVYDTFYFQNQKTYDDRNYDGENELEHIENNEDEFGGDADNENLSLSEDEEDGEEVSESVTVATILNTVRTIVKFFKLSTVRNDILQAKIVNEIGHELILELDVKHRWNSIQPMLHKFLMVQKPIEEALKELNASHLFLGIDVNVLKDLCSILKPIELTALALGRKDANLITAKSAIQFLFSKFDSVL